MTPTPTSDTNFTLIRDFGFEHFKLKINCEKRILNFKELYYPLQVIINYCILYTYLI